MARTVLDAGLWMHTSRQYHHALEVLGGAFAEDPSRVPPLIVKLGGGTAADIRATIAENLGPLGTSSIALGQLSPVGELADDLLRGGAPLDALRRIRDEGLVGRFVLETFPWTSAAPLAALRAGHLDGLVDGFITYDNPLQRFAANELWDELLARDASIISMRTVCGAPVQRLRDVPGAAWLPYLQQRAVEVAPVFERSGVDDWIEFCFRFVRSTPQVVATVGATSRPEHLDELLTQSRRDDTLPVDVLDEPWTM
ncbi:hypothetical protein [uncultured Friedmanniella sp.]|uniref:hypothetical protein n=1 Tax=uncultured Friedmanniella sp. TaxID=335381 RepID=UPI0035CA754E